MAEWTKLQNAHDLPWAVVSVVGSLVFVGGVLLVCNWTGVL